MFSWLPTINHLFPGALTPFTAPLVSIEWWLVYARQAHMWDAEQRKQQREMRRRG